MRVPKFLLPAPKIGFWAQKRPNLAQNWHFGPNIGIFAPFDLKPDQKTMQTSCLDGFLLCWYQNFYLLPYKIKIFGPKTAKFGPKYAFLVILGQILPFCTFCPMIDQKNNVNKVPRWVFRYVGNKAYDFSSKKKDFLPKNDQIWPKIGIFGQFGPGHAGLFSALLVGRLVVVARGLYLARHLFTLSFMHKQIPFDI